MAPGDAFAAFHQEHTETPGHAVVSSQRKKGHRRPEPGAPPAAVYNVQRSQSTSPCTAGGRVLSIHILN